MSFPRARWRRFGARSPAVFSAAVFDKRLHANPVTGIRPRKVERSSPLILETEEVAAILAHLNHRYVPAAMLAAGAGLRVGEAMGLTPFRVEWLAPEPFLHVERQLLVLPGSPAFLKLPKGDKARKVPLAPSVREALATHLANYPRCRVLSTRGQGGGGALLLGPDPGEASGPAAHCRGLRHRRP